MGPQGFLNLVFAAAIIGLFIYFLTQVVSKEDQIIDGVGRLADGFFDLSDSIKAGNEESEQRFQRLEQWLRAGCYASANGSSESREHCDEVGAP